MSLAADFFIRSQGMTVTVYKIVSEVFYSDYDELDWENSTKTSYPAKMLIGNRKSERGSIFMSDAGREGIDPVLIVFFPSDVDVSFRDGYNADVVELANGDRYRVNRMDVDRILGVIKNKVFLSALTGKEQG